MADIEHEQGQTVQPKSKAAHRELKLAVKISEAEVQRLMSAIQRSVIEALERLATRLEKAAATAAAAQKPAAAAENAVAEKPAGWLHLPEAERLKAVDLRTGLLLGKVPDTAGLLIDVKTTAQLLNVSQRTLYRLDQLEAVPPPVRIAGRLIRWRLGEIIAWMDAGCPLRRSWTYDGEAEKTKRRH